MTKSRITQQAIRQLWQGKPDQFAYEVARSVGYEGTFDEWLNEVWSDGKVVLPDSSA